MTFDENNLATWSPQQVDTQLAELYQQDHHLHRRQRLLERLTDDHGRAGELAEVAKQLVVVSQQVELLHEQYEQRGPWERAFLVVSSTGGHVHGTMTCPTCRPTTQFTWLPEYSGASRDTIVQAAGERACTVCYPDAPTRWRSQPTTIFSPDEQVAARERSKRAATREQVAGADAAKRILAPDGGTLRVKSHGEVKTERTAQSLYVERAAELFAEHQGWLGTYRALYADEIEPLLAALAHKRGQTVEQVRAALEPRVRARARRDYQ